MDDLERLRKQEKLLDTYTEERECDYRDRHYRVRDNGSVLRLPKATMNGHSEPITRRINISSSAPIRSTESSRQLSMANPKQKPMSSTI